MRVYIYKPGKTPTQSGRAGTRGWLLEPELITSRRPEPLMGWASAGDTFTELRRRLRFNRKEDAVAFAERNGWDYTIDEYGERRSQARKV